MDIWAWVWKAQDELRENGRERLAELIDLVPEYATNNDHQRVDSVMPEALALCREAKNAWVEIFFRHWDLQSRVLHRLDVKGALPDAVSLIERASREDGKNCPQAVCATQDLASCYAYLDGPGYANERLAVASETLARINAEWPCFTCISSEYAGALLDLGRYDELVGFIERQRLDLVKSGHADRKDLMAEPLISALIALGRLPEALEHAERSLAARHDDSHVQSRSIDRARVLARLGRTAEALQLLPSFEKVLGTVNDYRSWIDATAHLALAKAVPNDGVLHAKLNRLLSELRDHGVARIAFEVAETQGRLALARHKPRSAERSVASMREILPSLRAPLNAPELLAKLESEIGRSTRIDSSFESPEQILPLLGDDLETNLDLLEPAFARWPEDENLALALATTWISFQEPSRAEEVLSGFLRHTISQKIVLVLAHLFREQGRKEALEALLADLQGRTRDPEVLAACVWPMGLGLYQSGEKEQAAVRLEQVLSMIPEAVNTRTLLARIKRESGDHHAALAHLDHLVAQGAEPGGHDWDRIISATILGRWEAVRNSATRLGLEIEGEGPIDEPWELVRIRFDDLPGDRYELHAVRTGPVTARVVEISDPLRPQHFRDSLVFDPRPQNAPPEKGEEEHHTFIYPAVTILTAGNMRGFVVDGVHPGAETLAALRQAFAELGGSVEVRSSDEYRVERDEEELPGIFAYLAVPALVAEDIVTRVLRKYTGELQHPLEVEDF